MITEQFGDFRVVYLNFSFCLVLSSKHDMVLEEAPCDNVENQNLSPLSHKGKKRGNPAAENYEILPSPVRGSKRQRGRPAGTNMNRGKTGATQTRRTWSRIGRKPAKISGNESDDSSHDNTSFRDEVDIGEGKHGMVAEESSDMQRNEAIKDSKSLQSGKAAEQEVVGDIRFDGHSHKISQIEMIEKHNSQDRCKPEKLEVMADPVQAMLFDLIPSLGTKNVQTTHTSTEAEKPPVDMSLGMKNVQTTNTSTEDEKPPFDMDAEPTKKKKVSYKDLASQLLKDW